MIGNASPVASLQRPQASASSKLRASAREFEGMLLASLLQGFEETFSSIPGEDKDESLGQYRYMGTQALGAALASSGGIGVAELIQRRLGTAGHS